VRDCALDDYLNRIAAALGIARDRVAAHQGVEAAMVGAIGAYPAGSVNAFEMRMFAPGAGVPEERDGVLVDVDLPALRTRLVGPSPYRRCPRLRPP
jgi:hypothetical protein